MIPNHTTAGAPLSDRPDLTKKYGPRPALPDQLVPDAMRLCREDREMQGTYTPGCGPLHYAGGTWYIDHFRKMAGRWRKAAESAERIAQWMEDTPLPELVTAEEIAAAGAMVEGRTATAAPPSRDLAAALLDSVRASKAKRDGAQEADQ